MKQIYKGKTKDVFELDDGNFLLKFKDDVTGTDGVFDPGANQVGLAIEGAGKAALQLTKMFFEKLHDRGIPTHYIESNISEATMKVKPARAFGNGVEVICRFRAVGSFIRRYGMYATEGQPLDAFVEFTLKDDEREDPPITEDALEILGIIEAGQAQTIKETTRQICSIIKDELALKGIELYDIKLEFGLINDSNEVVLIDEISGGNMRTFKNGKRLEPLELTRLALE